MKKIVSLTLFAMLGVYLPAFAQKTSAPKFSVEIIPKNSTHVANVTNDKIIVITGSTYAFTVDTHAESGLISTRTTVKQLLSQIRSKDGSTQQYGVHSKEGSIKTEGELVNGDQLIVTSQDGKTKKIYTIAVEPMALSGQLWLEKKQLTVNAISNLTIFLTAGQRSPDATVRIWVPAGITVTKENTTVNVIGRGDVLLKDLSTQPIGRVGSKYSYKKVGDVAISKSADGRTLLTFKHLDLRPANGADVRLVIRDIKFSRTGDYFVKASYTTSKPETLTSAGTGTETASITVTPTIADFERMLNKDLQFRETNDTYTSVSFKWGSYIASSTLQLLQSVDSGKTWVASNAKIDRKKNTATIAGLIPDKLYRFKLYTKEGVHKGSSNEITFFSGKMDVKLFGVNGDGVADHTEKTNEAISYLNSIGGGTLLFSDGVYNVRTVHLKSNVWLYVKKGAIIRAIKGADAPETTWFSDKKYRSGLSPTDTGPYDDPENYMTKQDVGHHYFRNSMFFSEREDNIKIIGSGLITGNGNLVTGDRVMNNAPDNRADKMFTFKLCTNIEIGGIYRSEDLWYDAAKDEPYYIRKDGSIDFDTDNMLQIDQGGHFVLLATGTDNINVHNTYFAKRNQSNVRDIYDFMACNNVTVTNIYSKVSSDDIVKPGSDCALGFTRPARNYKVRNIIGDTNCNLFQIGSETADDIMDVHVDNIYVLGANKAGFSISTNDGAHIKDIHLNCGHTGILHSRSKMLRTHTPFFISISNRGRILGATVSRFKFDENGVKHDELLVTNVNIGIVENILINGVDVSEVYAGSSFGGKRERWKAYDATQRTATPIVAGYSLPKNQFVEGGLNFTLPNGLHTGYIKNISFNDVQFTLKGGNPITDTAASPPELGVGQYNVSNLKVQPSFGLWARHVKGIDIRNCSFNVEKTDSRYALFFDDVIGADVSDIKTVKAANNPIIIKLKDCAAFTMGKLLYYNIKWSEQPIEVSNGLHEEGSKIIRF
ncbi:endopygalactorunase [Lacibacter sp. H407]|uniref:endopygalactorunase n=1 Tax=Lacibacter sp. H407 TaxID=3133423 RepID=UPI0030BCB2B4